MVFFTMTTSSAEDMPRGAEFLFSRNRLNVAISRARCLAYLVCTEAAPEQPGPRRRRDAAHLDIVLVRRVLHPVSSGWSRPGRMRADCAQLPPEDHG